MERFFSKVDNFLLSISLWEVSAILLSLILTFGSASEALAASTSNFTQEITAGTLAVDITNSSYVTVANPSVTMGSTAFSFSCQTATGTFGTSSEQIYISNPDAADSGWTVTVAAASTTSLWDSAGTDFDFNDPTSSGCTDGADGDSVGGQMTLDPSGATLSAGACSTCSTTNVSLGSSTAFSEGVTDSVTIVTGAAGSDDIGDWYVRNVDISQSIPAEQPAAADYNIDIVLSIQAS